MRTISARRKGRVNRACVAAVEPYRSSAGRAFPFPRKYSAPPEQGAGSRQENLLPAPSPLLPYSCPHPLSPSPGGVLTPCPPLHVVERGDGGDDGDSSSGGVGD